MPDVQYKLTAWVDGEQVYETEAPTVDFIEERLFGAEKSVDKAVDQLLTEAYND